MRPLTVADPTASAHLPKWEPEEAQVVVMVGVAGAGCGYSLHWQLAEQLARGLQLFVDELFIINP